MGKTINRRWVLARRPVDKVDQQDFQRDDTMLDPLGESELRIRVTHQAFAPTQRVWIERDSYLPAVPVGGVVRSVAIGEVEESNVPDFSKGDLVEGGFGWQNYWQGPALTDLGPIKRLPPGITPEQALGAIGISSKTAWFGVNDVLKPREGETALVSAAAGATGSAAGQLLKAAGARVIGIAGGQEKAHWVKAVAGLDECIDYKGEDVAARIRELAPNGLDMVYENVGGAILDAALENLALNARIAFCGAISSYDTGEIYGLKNYPNLVVQRASIRGFLILDYADRNAEAEKGLSDLLKRNEIRFQLDIQHGFENIPKTLTRIFSGQNLGKQILVV